MGNCCGKSSGNFQGEGRTLGSAPSNPPAQRSDARAAVPASKPSTGGGGGRTLGGATANADSGSSPREAAARAAEERAKSSSSAQGKGKLGKQLDAQRGKTQADTLAQTARDNVAARDADAATQARNWD